MATGLAIPVRPGSSGGAVTVTGSEQLRKVILLAVAAGDDENPFQELGNREDIIFQVNDPSIQGVIRQRIRRILSKFSDRAALDPSKGIDVYALEGEVYADFTVINLETDDPLNFNIQLT